MCQLYVRSPERQLVLCNHQPTMSFSCAKTPPSTCAACTRTTTQSWYDCYCICFTPWDQSVLHPKKRDYTFWRASLCWRFCFFSHKYFLRKMNSTTSSQVFVKLWHTGGERPFWADHDGEFQQPQIRQRHPIPVQEYKHQHCHLCHLHVRHCHQPGRKWPLHVDPHIPYLPQVCLHHLHD